MKKILSFLLLFMMPFPIISPAAGQTAGKVSTEITLTEFEAISLLENQLSAEYTNENLNRDSYFISNENIEAINMGIQLIESFLEAEQPSDQVLNAISDILGWEVESLEVLTKTEVDFLENWLQTYRYSIKIEQVLRLSKSRPKFKVTLAQFINAVRLFQYIDPNGRLRLYGFLQHQETFEPSAMFGSPSCFAQVVLTRILLGRKASVDDQFLSNPEQNLNSRVLLLLKLFTYGAHDKQRKDNALTALHNLTELSSFIELEDESMRTDLEALRDLLTNANEQLKKSKL